MKSSILLMLLACSLNAAETQITSCHRDAQTYAKGAYFRHDASRDILEKFAIVLDNKDVLDIECGVGENTHYMAMPARTVHGIDSRQELIQYAQEKYSLEHSCAYCPTLSFEHCSVENFKLQKRYNMATAFFCLHLVKDRQKAFAALNKSLVMEGEVVATINTTSNPQPLDLQVFLELMPRLKTALPFLDNFNIERDLGCSYPTKEELMDLIVKNGFTRVGYNPCYKREYLVTREELADFMWPIAMYRPAMQQVPHNLWENCFELFISHFLTKLQQNEDGKYILPIINTTVFHLVKIAEIAEPHVEGEIAPSAV